MSKSDQEEHHMILFRKLDRCFGGNISDSIDSHATLVAVASYSLVVISTIRGRLWTPDY